MITSYKLMIYRNYNGDIDGFARTASTEAITDQEWADITRLLSLVHILRFNNPSTEFADRINGELDKNCDNENTRNLILRYEK